MRLQMVVLPLEQLIAPIIAEVVRLNPALLSGSAMLTPESPDYEVDAEK